MTINALCINLFYPPKDQCIENSVILLHPQPFQTNMHTAVFDVQPKLYIPSTVKIGLMCTVAHTICVCSKMLSHGLNHGLFLSLSSLYPAIYIELYMC